jgi:hypothetical protein
MAVSIKGEGRKVGVGRKKGWLHRFLVGTVPQRGKPDTFAIIEQFMKRVGFGNWYSEKVTDHETGDVIHECHEPFDKHQRHGSAKPILAGTPSDGTIIG